MEEGPAANVDEPSSAESTPKKKSGGQPGNKNNTSGKEAVRGKGRQSELAAMRWVWTHPRDEDKTYQHWNLRQFLTKDRKGFQAQLVRLESEEKANQREKSIVDSAGVAAVHTAPPATDLTTADLKALIEKMLEGTDGGECAVIAGEVAREGSAGVAGELTTETSVIDGGGRE